MNAADNSVLFMRLVFGLIIGAVLAGVLAIYGLIPLWLGISLPIITGLLAVLLGDQFLVGFMRIYRWLQ